MTETSAHGPEKARFALPWLLSVLVGLITITVRPILAFSNYGNPGAIPPLMDASVLFMTVSGGAVIVGGVFASFRWRKELVAWTCLALMAMVAVTTLILMWIAIGGVVDR